MRRILIDDAIRAIHPDAQFTTVDGVITEWKGPGVVPSDEELNAKLIELKANEPFKLLREERNRRLAETDFYALSDVTMSSDMQTYRQNLRDLPSGKDTVEKCDNVTWPTKP